MLRRPKEGASACLFVSARLSNTAAKRRDVAQQLLGQLRRIAENNSADFIAGAFNSAAYRKRQAGVSSCQLCTLTRGISNEVQSLCSRAVPFLFRGSAPEQRQLLQLVGRMEWHLPRMERPSVDGIRRTTARLGRACHECTAQGAGPLAANDGPVAEEVNKDTHRASGHDLKRQRCLRGHGRPHGHVKGRKKQNGSTLRPPTSRAIQCTLEKTEALEKLVKNTDNASGLACDHRGGLLADALRASGGHIEKRAPRHDVSRSLCVLKFAATMCQFHVKTPSESNDQEPHRNLQNVFLLLVTSFQIKAALEACLTEEELGRVGLSCHLAPDCLHDTWNMF